MWLINHLQLQLEAACHLIPESQTLTGWINGDLYTPAGEKIGILPVPTVDEHENPPSSSSRSIVHQCFSVLDTSHISDAGSSNQPRPSSKKHKPDDTLNSQQASKKSRQEHKCQKCGSQSCAGRGTRKYCKNPCQDCGNVECSGCNSQHPKKRCTIGQNLHHNDAIEFIMY